MYSDSYCKFHTYALSQMNSGGHCRKLILNEAMCIFNHRLELIVFRRILQEIDMCIFNHGFELNVFHRILQETDMKQGHVYFQSVV